MEFEGWPSTARLNKDAVYTEKLDGTNAAIVIEFGEDGEPVVGAQSRKRLITPEDDNFGFARWVQGHQNELITVLGEGRHFGEWYGSGIQRGYGRSEKRFALFNTARWDEHREELGTVPGLECVTVLAKDTFSTGAARDLVEHLRRNGSVHVPGYLRPEGVCVFHTASRTVFKTFLENDQIPKGLQA